MTNPHEPDLSELVVRARSLEHLLSRLGDTDDHPHAFALSVLAGGIADDLDVLDRARMSPAPPPPEAPAPSGKATISGNRISLPDRELDTMMGELRALTVAIGEMPRQSVPPEICTTLAMLAEERVNALDNLLQAELPGDEGRRAMQ